MSYRLSTTDLVHSTPHHRWQRMRLPAELGSGYADRLQLDDGLGVACSHYRPQRDLCERSVVERDSPALVITLALDGASSYRREDGGEFAFRAGHTTVTAFRQARGERRYAAGQDVRQVRLIVEAVALHKYALQGLLGGLPGDTAARQLCHGASDLASHRLACRLARLHASGGGLLDIQVAALGLLAEQARRLAPPAGRPHSLSLHDEQRLLQARDIILQQFARPLTVPYLCTTVGLNEFKFKQAFGELFGTTPHRLLTEIRMRKAWELLEAGEQAASVGYQVGYQHPSSFSAAFQRFFGRTPKSVAVRR